MVKYCLYVLICNPHFVYKHIWLMLLYICMRLDTVVYNAE